MKVKSYMRKCFEGKEVERFILNTLTLKHTGHSGTDALHEVRFSISGFAHHYMSATALGLVPGRHSINIY